MLMHLLLLFVFRYKMSPVTIDNPLYCHTGELINQRNVNYMHINLQLLITNVAYLEKTKFVLETIVYIMVYMIIRRYDDYETLVQLFVIMIIKAFSIPVMKTTFGR